MLSLVYESPDDVLPIIHEDDAVTVIKNYRAPLTIEKERRPGSRWAKEL